jgi:hypothetical protein
MAVGVAPAAVVVNNFITKVTATVRLWATGLPRRPYCVTNCDFITLACNINNVSHFSTP